MFPVRYYGNRMFAPRYFPKVGATPAVPVTTVIAAAHAYDAAGATGSVSGGTVLTTATSSATGSVDSGTVQRSERVYD